MAHKTLPVGLAAAALCAFAFVQLADRRSPDVVADGLVPGQDDEGLQPTVADAGRTHPLGGAHHGTARLDASAHLSAASARISAEAKEACAAQTEPLPPPPPPGTVIGRTILGTSPIAGVRVSFQSKTDNPWAAKNDRERRIRERLNRLRRSSKYKGKSRGQWDTPTVLNQSTASDGSFRATDVPPGPAKFTFEFPAADESERRRMGDSRIATLEVHVRSGTTTELQDVRLRFDDEYMRVRTTPSIYAQVRVRCDQEGLSVQVEDQVTKLKRTVGTTDALGEFSFLWEEPAPVRLSLFDETKELLGSTEGFVTLPTHTESIWDIPVVPGSLRIWIPDECEPLAGEAVQYSLHRVPENQAFHRVETVYGDAPSQKTARIKSTPLSLKFKSVRPGKYQVVVRLMEKQLDGRWLPVGTPLKGNAVVEPRQLSKCRVR